MQNIDKLGERLQIIRKLNQKSQNEIAEILNTTQQQYWKYENNMFGNIICALFSSIAIIGTIIGLKKHNRKV